MPGFGALGQFAIGQAPPIVTTIAVDLSAYTFEGQVISLAGIVSIPIECSRYTIRGMGVQGYDTTLIPGAGGGRIRSPRRAKKLTGPIAPCLREDEMPPRVVYQPRRQAPIAPPPAWIGNMQREQQDARDAMAIVSMMMKPPPATDRADAQQALKQLTPA